MSRNVIFSTLNTTIFILCIVTQLLVAWLSLNDIIWIFIGLIGILLGIISLFMENWTGAVIGFGFIMAFCYSYLLWLYLWYYGLYIKYGINMPIAILGILGIIFSGLTIIFDFFMQRNPSHPPMSMDDNDAHLIYGFLNKEDLKFIIKREAPLQVMVQLIQFITSIITLTVAIISLIVILN